ncbi:MAG: cell surface protein SprA, partial [Bacteroidota bacterium]
MKIDGLLLIILLTLAVSVSLFAEGGGAHLDDPYAPEYIQQMSQDTISPINDRSGDYINNPNNNPFDLRDPGVIEKDVEYDPASGNYIITERIGSEYFRTPTYMTFEEYLEYREEQQRQEYFRQLSGLSDGSGSGGLRDPIEKVDVKKDLINRLFGGTEVEIKPQGNIDLTFGFDFQSVNNPILTQRQQRNGGFDFDMDIQMNVVGKIGEKLNLSTNYNTGATFGTENLMKIDYNSDSFSEDEILKKIEAGNVSLPLKGTLIQGSQNLFGLKTELQFGRLFITGVASQQRSQQQSIQIQGGAQVQEFE